ncbi:MAG TPA: PilZ domain-containing protein [Polyangiaceae bacterium]|nr:PilZ domain-containing protein [Polyangiaceae bacterium]
MLAHSFTSWSGRDHHSTLARALRLLTPSVSRSACGGAAPNRRREMRRLAHVGCRVRRIDTWKLVGDRTVDLSPKGMLVLSDERLDWGSELVVSFQATELPIWFDTMATVVRVVEGRRPGDPGRSLGLCFETLPAVSRLILRGHLRSLPAAVPQRLPPAHLTREMIDPDYARVVDDIWAGRA